MTRQRHEFTAEKVAELLDALDARLQERGVAASIFVVGGAAIAANRARRERVTEDVDALTRDSAVLEEAKVLARERGLPENWLNPNAGMWMPPLPAGVLDPPPGPGLRVTYAEDGFLLATKLIAQRAKDADDVVALAGRLGLETASPEELESHIRRFYTDPAALELVVDGTDVDHEIGLLAQDASRMLQRAATAGAGEDDPAGRGAERLRRSTDRERRRPPTSGQEEGGGDAVARARSTSASTPPTTSRASTTSRPSSRSPSKAPSRTPAPSPTHSASSPALRT